MDAPNPNPQQAALQRAIDVAGGKTALMRKLNERGHRITSHNTIGQWQKTKTPPAYCPDIEDLTGVPCEELCVGPNWGALRKTERAAEPALAKEGA